MSALQVEVIREDVTVGRAGKVESWLVRVNQQVAKGDRIALFDDGKGSLVEITAPYSGRVSTLLCPGLSVVAGGTIAQLEPDCPPEPLKRATPIAPPQYTPPVPKIAPAPSGEALEASPRRSTLGDEEQLVAVEELTLPAPLPAPKARPRRPRMARRTTRPTDHQVDDFKDRAEKFGKLGYGVGELDRVMYRLLLRLSDQDLARELEAQRDEEQAGRYCFGNRPM